jgi:hypothetical protein
VTFYSYFDKEKLSKMNKILLELLLLKRIDVMKKRMIDNAKSTGINSPETLRCSQELDILLNRYRKLFPHNK